MSTQDQVLEKAIIKGGKFLTFELSKEMYGLEILKVQEIIGIMKVTRVPRTPDFIRGVINLRGKVIPVMDLRLKFGLQAAEDTKRTCIIVVQIRRQQGQFIIGIIVDEVSEVLEIGSDKIEPPPSFGAQVNTEFLRGMGKAGEKVILLLDVDQVMSNGELAMVEKL